MGAAAGVGAGAGAGAGAFLSGCVVKDKPRPRSAKGPTISSVTSTFLPGRRDNIAGFTRFKISCKGKLMSLLSDSPPELTNTPGASCRNSPKEILTAPKASWLITKSACKRIV
jgi:hypothetical protein